MTREEILSLVISNTGRSDKQELMQSAINLALTEISQRHDFQQMMESHDLALAAGESSVALPDRTLSVLEARIHTEVDVNQVTHLILLPKQTILREFPDLNADVESRPICGFIEQNVLYVNPPANEAYVIKTTLFRLFPTLATGETVPANLMLINALVSWVTAYTFRSIEKFQESDRWMLEYERSLRVATRADNRQTGTQLVHQGFRGTPAQTYSPEPWHDPFVKKW